jgi:hypothetical protein
VQGWCPSPSSRPPAQLASFEQGIDGRRGRGCLSRNDPRGEGVERHPMPGKPSTVGGLAFYSPKSPKAHPGSPTPQAE